jgi:hypothetical protein
MCTLNGMSSFRRKKQECMEMPMFRQESRETVVPDMGLAHGCLMHQEIYDNEYGNNAWDQDNRYRCFIHLTIAGNNTQSPGIGRQINRRLPKITGAPGYPCLTTMMAASHYLVPAL